MLNFKGPHSVLNIVFVSENYEIIFFACCFIWVCNMVSHIKIWTQVAGV
jgi:hypothetical protein